MPRAALLPLVLFLGCFGPEPERAETGRTMSQPDPNTNYQGGAFDGPYKSVQKITLTSGAWFEVGDPFDAAVAALRTLDMTTYDRTFHQLHDPVEIPFEVQQRRGRPIMSAWHYEAGGMFFRIVVDYTRGHGRVDRLDLYDSPTIRDNGGDILKGKQDESLELFNRRRAAGKYVGEI